jgi:uncharacterized lipoprotein YddW (UPF0748 family)
MKRWRFLPMGLLMVLVFLGLNLGATGHAEVRYELHAPRGETLPLSTTNQKRESDSLVLYTNDFGNSTRTNPYGVEVSAVPVPGVPNRYRVAQVTRVETCQLANTLSQCGNMIIPPKGIVLSATGNKRELLAQNFLPGTEFELKTLLAYESRVSIDAMNPTPETNPSGSGFPGFRGGNQMILYNVDYGKPTTETNEFGFEVTVINGRVVEQQGANSTIPTEPNSYILSGHGKSREWLLENAPIGSKVDFQENMIISTVDRDTYIYQLQKMVSKIESLRQKPVPQDIRQQIDALKVAALQQSDEAVAQQAMALKQKLTPMLWSSYPSANTSATRAIWHRPSEGSLKEIRQSLDLIRNAGFNTLYLETYLHGDPIFPSKTFEAYHIPQKLPFKVSDSRQDLLQTWLEEAHKRNMKVHVWFQTFYAGNIQFDKTMGSILTTYPQWANIQRSGLGKEKLPPSTLEGGAYFLDPANQEAQKFILDLIDEIVTRYPIDGFQLDYIRYPSSFGPDKYSYVATTWGYTPVARELFQARTGKDPAEITPESDPELWVEWNDFKTRQVDRFVQKAHDLIKMVRPQMPLSVAVFPKPDESLTRKHQNWVVWAQNSWVDFIAPMTLTSSTEAIALDTREVKEQSKLPVITGVFGPFNGNSATEVVDQVWAALSSGATGIALFDTAHLTQKMAEALHMGIFKLPSTAP